MPERRICEAPKENHLDAIVLTVTDWPAHLDLSKPILTDPVSSGKC